MGSQPASQGYYVLRTKYDIMASWAGRQCELPYATSAGTGGYQRPRTRRTARRSSAARLCGTKAALTAGHGKRESRRGVAVKRRQRGIDAETDEPEVVQITGFGASPTEYVAQWLVKIDHSSSEGTLHHIGMKVAEKQALAVWCPTCGAKPGERCELSTGQPRTDPHRDRRLIAKD